MLETITRLSAYLFLAGILMVLAGSVPSWRARFPRLFAWGFLLAALSIVLVVVFAFMLAPPLEQNTSLTLHFSA